MSMSLTLLHVLSRFWGFAHVLHCALTALPVFLVLLPARHLLTHEDSVQSGWISSLTLIILWADLYKCTYQFLKEYNYLSMCHSHLLWALRVRPGFYLLLCFWPVVQCLAFRKHSIHVCWINEFINMCGRDLGILSFRRGLWLWSQEGMVRTRW